MNTRDLLNKVAMRYPDREIMVFENTRLTARQYVDRVYRLGNALLNLGLKKGDRVALLLQNSNHSAECFHAAGSAGLPFVSLNFRNAAPEHEYILNHADARAIIVGEEYLEVIQSVLPRTPLVEYVICVGGNNRTDCHSYDELLKNSTPEEPPTELCPDDLSAIRYTSGTTGKPKGVRRSSRSDMTVLFNALIEGLFIESTDAVALTAPVTHASGSMILPHIVRGAKVVIMKGFDPVKLMQTIEKERITTLYMVPTMIVMLINHPDMGNYDLSSIRTIRYGASPIAPNVLEKAIGIFGNVFVQGYGLTEGSMPVTLLTKEDHIMDGSEKKLKRLKSIGREVIVANVRIMDENCNFLPPGETGEIVVQTEQNMVGYWKNPEATAETLKDGWLHTGDMGVRDEDNYIYLVDRKKDMIISGGFNIYPREVEDILYLHEAILEAAVIGVPDEKWGESVKAIVTLKEGKMVTEEELIAHCKEHLASYKKPASVDFIDELPKNANGKILKKDLRATYWEDQARGIN
jgi:long-chain acyl-CoA synthetase